MSNNAEEKSETFDFTVVNKRASKLRERNRIIAQDNNGIYREFVISHVVDNFDGTTDIESNASYLEDIDKSKPIKPGKYSAYSTSQALNETLRNTGWEISEDTEHGGMRTTSWTSYSTPYEVINMLCTTYGMVADYSIELGSHTVEHRYVTLKQPVSLFKGKEITKGKDLTEMTRTVDMSEVRTALYAVGPENDKGERISVVVKDDEAQAQFGLPGRYLWSVYEPESDDSSMTEERLTTLAQTELNKRNQSAISYEISSIDIHKHYPEMVVSMHDTVRIKDRDFRPPLYIEAEVIGVDYDLILDESSYKFGNVVEYDESSLRSIFDKKIDEIRKKLNDNVTNINTIVNDAIQGELEYYEPKIIKSDTEPEKPIEDMLWYDTSNPNVAVLKRYHNGEWLNETAKDVEQLGGMTREHVLYNSITNTFQNLNIQHSKLLEEVTGLLNNEYLVDNDIKLALDNAQNNLVDVYNHIKDNLDNMNEDTATIGKLIDTQALFLRYRERLQDLYRAMRDAQVSADKRLKLLQSQYTDEKFNNAMSEVANALPNGHWDSEKGQLIADFPNGDELEKLRQSLQEYADGKISDLQDAVGKQIDSRINNTKEELSAHIGTVERKIDGLEIGGRNLFQSYRDDLYNLVAPQITTTEHFSNEKLWATQLYGPDYFRQYLEPNTTYTIHYEIEITDFRGLTQLSGRIFGLILYDYTQATTLSVFTVGYLDETVDESYLNKRFKVTKTFTTPDNFENKLNILSYAGYGFNDSGERLYVKSNIYNLKLEKGTVATDWTPAPEDTEKTIEPLKARVTNTESDIKVLQDGLRLSATKNDVEQTLNEQLKPIKNQVKDQQATLDVLPSQIDAKVSKQDYTTDKDNIVQRLNNADSERKQLSNSIEDRVTLKQFEDMTIGGRNYLAIDNLENGTFKLEDGTPVGSDPTRIRNIDYIDVEPVNYVIKVNKPLENRKIQVNFYQYDNANNLVKNSGFVDVDDTFSYAFDSGVAKTKLLIRADDNNELSVEDIANAQIKLEKGTVPTDYDTDPSETSRKLTQLDTAVTQNGEDIQLRATKKEFNQTNKTLSQTISDFTNNVATGMTFTYDENGTIQSMNIGSDGIKLRGDKVDITVNKEFNVVAQNLNNKVGKDEIINRLNLSPEGLDIDVNRVGIRGGDNTTYIEMNNNYFKMAGIYTRNWRGDVQKDEVYMNAYNGYLRFRNDSRNRSLYYSDFGISTYVDANSDEASGTIQFFDYTYSTARGVTVNSVNGVVGLKSDNNRVVLESGLTTNIGSENYSVYIRPTFNSRPGLNEFAFYVKDNDGSGNTDGVILFGEVSNEKGLAGSGIRFRKHGVKGMGMDEYEPVVYATNNTGDIGTGSFYGSRFYGDLASKNDFAYVQTAPGGRLRIVDGKGYNNGDPNYQDLQCDKIQANSIRVNTGKNFYIGVSTNELWVTNNLLYNGGDTGFKPVKASDFLKASSAEFKKDIEEWNYDALSVIADELQMYSYKYKDDERETIHHGPVIGDGYDIPTEFVFGNGINTNEMLSWALRAIQQLNEKVKVLEEQNNGK
nr:phage tail spike protein [Staphylococcus caprae]